MNYMLSIAVLGIFWMFSPPAVFGQDSATYEDQYQLEYEKRIQKSHINGFYIPTDLPDAIRILEEIVDEEGKQRFASRTDSIAVNRVFFSFGRWININWGMEFGSRLTVALNQLGVSYPDDMVRLIMYAFHRHLRNEDLNVDQLVERVIEERKARDLKVENLARDEP